MGLKKDKESEREREMGREKGKERREKEREREREGERERERVALTLTYSWLFSGAAGNLRPDQQPGHAAAVISTLSIYPSIHIYIYICLYISFIGLTPNPHCHLSIYINICFFCVPVLTRTSALINNLATLLQQNHSFLYIYTSI